MLHRTTSASTQSANNRTRQLPRPSYRPRERIDAWHEAFGRDVLDADITPSRKRPFSAIDPLVRDIGALLARRTPEANPALQVLLTYLELARQENVVTTPELETAFTNHVCDVLVLTLGPTRDAAEVARTRLCAVRLHAIKEDICRNLSRPNLSVHAIAARHRVSARYVQILFEESGSTFTRYIMEQRLAGVHKALVARPDATISSIAYDAGFNDIANFNRVFRQHFGCTPSDVRKAALPSRGPKAI
jgi:AraC-like DNA-binding protein